LKITIVGLAITSSWGNGHATTYRALARALRKRGHEIVFFERDLEWYASNRDMPEPPFCRVHIYERWDEVVPSLRFELRDSDVAIIGSYSPDGIAASEEILNASVPVKAFYDIDTPITVAKLRCGDREYLTPQLASGFDIYFSFTGGPLLRELENEFGVAMAVPLYCSFDPERYRTCTREPRFRCDLSYMGTYSPDRQEKLEHFFCAPARLLQNKQFLLAGPQYPKNIAWPRNVQTMIHLEPKFHPVFYNSSCFTLNITRKEMSANGYSPSVRLFEAAGSGAAIISDNWPGLQFFFTPGEEILLASSTDDVVRFLTDISPAQRKLIARNAQRRVLEEHSSGRRAQEFEDYIEAFLSRDRTPQDVLSA